jgi:streptogramin lyase
MKCFLAFLFVATACAQQAGRFELLANYRGLGGLVGTTTGPGATAGSELYYASYLYDENTIGVISIDPESGATEVFANPVQGEYGARNLVAGPDGNLYLGTLPTAHFLKLDRKLGKLIDLGRPSATEEYIWDIAFGSDQRLYGVTYPNCKLVRYDPASGKLEDLGRLDATEQYGRWIVSSSDGFLYIGIGTSRANIAAFNVRTGEHREILPADAQKTGIAKVTRGQDGKLYGSIGERAFRLEGWTAKELAANEKPSEPAPDRLRDGRTLELTARTLTIIDEKTQAKVERHITYAGEALPLFRIAFGPDGGLYGSTILPIHFVQVDLEKHRVTELGDLGGGEFYSMLNHGGRLLMAAYSGLSPLMSYQPGASFHPAPKGGNPELVNFRGADSAWRPQAMISGPDGLVYVGAVAGYGQIQAPLTVWDPKRGTVRLYDGIVRDQSVVSLVVWKDRIVGGTTPDGGGGSHPTQTEARLFVWNPKTGKREFDIIPVPGARQITDLVAASNGLVYGIADGTLFSFNPQSRQIVSKHKMPFSGLPYNSVALGPDGRIWGLAGDGIFAIDTKTDTVSLVARSPQRITGGFELRDGAIYFVSGSAVYRYIM